MAEARRRIEQIAFQTGLTLQELLAKPREQQTPTSLYVNPDDETQTWSGRGRKPAWLKAWLECGISLEELPRREVKATRHESAAK
jgi:DNA-binding protein H-NS